MASDKPDCNKVERYLQAVLGGILGYCIGKIGKDCYNYFRRRYRSANTTTSDASTAGGDDTRELDDLYNTLRLLGQETPVTSPGHAVSDMDRDIKKGQAYKEDVHNAGATRPWNDYV